jgi:hypothetical protein
MFVPDIATILTLLGSDAVGEGGREVGNDNLRLAGKYWIFQAICPRYVDPLQGASEFRGCNREEIPANCIDSLQFSLLSIEVVA